MRAPATILALLAASVAFALVPSAAACTYTPIVTVDGPAYPAKGVYVEEGCFWGDGTPAETVTVAQGTCVPAVYVVGQLVPGTGSCAGQSVTAYGVETPDVGVTVCAVHGWCATYFSTAYVNSVCEGVLQADYGPYFQATCTVT